MGALVEPRKPAWVGNAPAALSPLVGRQRESSAVRELLLRPSVRLVTVTGPGGVGKSRLAVEVARELTTGFDAVAFVPLAAISDPHLVAVTIARKLGLGSPDEMVAEALAEHLRLRSLLLVLDNFEHLLEAGPLLADLLVACPGLAALVTSRARLRISGEQIFAVPPLSLPDPGGPQPPDRLAQYGAVRLFVERARSVRPDFTFDADTAADVVEICRRLDGLPLAIELAAARTTVLAPAALLSRLTRRLPMLTGGARDLPERLRTMRAGIAWSYDLLEPDERTLFRRLAVFAGGFTLPAAEAAVPGEGPSVLDLVAGLVDKSLLRRTVDDAGRSRFTMLETIREYALDELVVCGEEEAARGAHAAFFQAMATDAEPALRGAEQQHHRDALEADLDNLRAALTWTLRDDASAADTDRGLALVGALWYFWFQRGLTSEGRRWLARALGASATGGSARIQALLGAGTLAWRQGDSEAAREHLDECVSRCRESGDLAGLAEALHVLGHVTFDQRDYVAARGLFTESLEAYRQARDIVGGLPLLGDLGLVAYHEGDYARAEKVFLESLELYRKHGLKDRVAGALNGLGDLARLADDGPRAAALYEESLALWRELRGTPGIASALHKLGQVSRSEGDVPRAWQRLAESVALQREIGNKQGIGECLAALAGVAADSGSVQRAARILAASVALLDAIGVPLAPADQVILSRDLDAVRSRLGAAWDPAWTAGSALSTDEAIALALVQDAEVSAPPSRSPLSHREREVSALIAQGLTNRQISTTLSIAEKTVGSHIAHIMTKLDLRSRTQIAVWAVGHGLGPEESGSG